MEIKQAKGFKMLPPASDKCQVCAADKHDDNVPHNRDSLYYQLWFNATHGRSPTWADASILCDTEMKTRLKTYLEKNGIKSEVIGDLP